MEVPNQLILTRCSTKTTELASIVPITREIAKSLIDVNWWSDLEDSLQNPVNEPDSQWEWRALVSKYQNNPYCRAVGVRTVDGAIQAAMLFRVDTLSAIENGQKAVFIDRLATAPWNRKNLVLEPLFRGGGEGLLVYAVAMSYSLGFSGRVNLFPIANEEFYASRGFIQTATIAEGDALHELPVNAAHVILQQRGLINA